MKRSDIFAFLRTRVNSSFVYALFVNVAFIPTHLITFKIAALSMGPTGFGEFSVARRAISTIAFPLLLGVGIGLSRYVAYSRQKTPGSAPPHIFLLAALAVSLPALAAMVLAMMTMDQLTAALLFGGKNFAHLVFPTSIGIAALVLHSIAYCHLVGEMRLWLASSIQLFNLGLLPVAAVALAGGDPVTALLVIGLGALVLPIAVLLVALRALNVVRDIKLLPKCTITLLKFGLPRLPGDFALFALFSVPTSYVAAQSGIEVAGAFSFTLSLMQAISSPFTTLGTVLLPLISGYISIGHFARVRNVALATSWATFIIVSLGVLFLEVALVPLVAFLLSPEFVAAVETARWLLLAAIPYTLFISLRGLLDALAVWPHNSVNLTGAFLLLLALLAVPNTDAHFGFSIAMLILGLLTIRSMIVELRRLAQHPASV